MARQVVLFVALVVLGCVVGTTVARLRGDTAVVATATRQLLTTVEEIDVFDMSPDELAEYLVDTHKLKQETADRLLAADVDGSVFFELDDALLQSEVGLESGIQRKRVLSIVKHELDILMAGGTDGNMEFWEFYALNRRKVNALAGCAIPAPRLTTLYLYFFDYDTLALGFTDDGTGLGFWGSLVLAPHLQQGYYASSLRSTNPFLAMSFMLTSVIYQFVEWAALVTLVTGTDPAKRDKWAKDAITGVMTAACCYVMFPIIPWWLCDISVYLVVFGQLFVATVTVCSLLLVGAAAANAAKTE